MKQILSITRKELESYLGSPLSLIFLGAFLAVVLFTFFTVETFFARGISDVRPLFQWMPILLIFLLAALTMRQWSEEQRSGTLEILITLPVSAFRLVMGKFLAVMVIIAIALILTLPLPLTVSILGNLDWGPVLGGYLAALLMAAAYAAIGLFVSSRTDNQIVALISTLLLGGIFYLVGTDSVTNYIEGPVSEILWAIGTGSRFESIQRGVIDLRDLLYYLTLAGIFLALNTISLDSIGWSKKQSGYQRNALFTTALIILNLAIINVWLYPLHGLRMDLTAQKEYTISQVTKDLVVNLEEPLLIRGYISEKTHPLLAPMVPQIKDMLREYEIASNGKVIAEVIDPLTDAEIEAEANQTYAIKPTPFQISGRNEASVINSYFDILIRYGDQSVVLGFQDLIEVQQSQTSVNVTLRNLEYDLTSAIKKVVYGFQSVDAVLAELEQPVKLSLIITPDTLPQQLAEADTIVSKVAQDIAGSSNGKFIFETINPDDPNSPITRQELIEKYGLNPLPTSLFSNESYYFQMLLQNADQIQTLYPPSNLTEGEVRQAIESALKRTSSGFLKVVGLWVQSQEATQDMFGQMQQPLSTYQLVNQQLGQEYTVQQVDLSTGSVPSNIDILLLISPQGFTEKDLFAVDQFLMRGGSVIVAANHYTLIPDQMQGFVSLQPIDAGVIDLLASYGVDISKKLVLDTQNEPFPVSVTRDLGGVQVQEIQAVNYPFFVDVRSDNMDTESPIVANLPAVTMNWASPVELNQQKNTGRETHILLQSSKQSWLREDVTVLPDYDTYPDMGFNVEGTQQSYPLAVSIQGTFESYYRDRANPFQGETTSDDELSQGPVPSEQQSAVSTIEQSPDSARLVVVGSASFVDDFVLQLSSRLSQERYLNNLSFLQNAVDWSVEDLDLLTIRGRGTATRILLPMNEKEQTFWEMVNYVLALVMLLSFYIYWQIRKHNEKPLQLLPANKEDNQ